MFHSIFKLSFIFFLFTSQINMLFADVVKPALIEISVNTDETFIIEVRTSIEALLTGINAKYKNTKDAPKAEQYDVLRVLPAKQLAIKFKPFESSFLQDIQLFVDDQKVQVKISKVEIPAVGYPKVPRTSLIVLEGKIERESKNITWLYPKKYGDNAVRVRQIDLKNEKWHWSTWQWLKNGELSKAFSLTEIFTQPPISEIIITYISAGFDHIIPKGLDHILFILGIFLLSTQLKPLLWQVTMFTIAHSVTLGLSMSGYINLPSSIVEPLIALSISYIALENIFHKTLHKSRLIVVFLFGLLHGLGFASMLADFGMPDNNFLTALISFNVGVELGQVTILAIGFLLVGFWFSNKPWYRSWIIIPTSTIISIIGLIWTYDRIVF